MQNRPSPTELTKKLREALELLGSSGYIPVDPNRVSAFFSKLDLFTPEEQTEGIDAALREVRASDYIGGRPPRKSFERLTQGQELFEFAWDSATFSQRMYLKFCLRMQDGKAVGFFLHSLHIDRPPHRGP